MSSQSLCHLLTLQHTFDHPHVKEKQLDSTSPIQVGEKKRPENVGGSGTRDRNTGRKEKMLKAKEVRSQIRGERKKTFGDKENLEKVKQKNEKLI